MNELKLHPKYGLNPTIPVCAFCHKPKNMVAMLGDSYDGEAPMHSIIDIEPCEECQKIFEQGVLIMEVEGPDSYIPINYAVVSDDLAKQLFKEPACSQILEERKCRVNIGFLEKAFGDITGLLEKVVETAEAEETEDTHECPLCPHARCTKDEHD